MKKDEVDVETIKYIDRYILDILIDEAKLFYERYPEKKKVNKLILD